MECPSCGIQLNEDGTVDQLPGEPDQHYADCGATFAVSSYSKNGEHVEYDDPKTGKPWNHYGPARDFMRQKRAMSGPRLTWRVE